MPDVNLNEDTQSYINMFYTPVITSYKFLKSFFAELYSRGEMRISRDLSEFFYNLKTDLRYNTLLKELHFKSNGIYHYSNELEDDILTLQNMGLLGKKNPSFGIILIEYNDAIADETLHSLSDDYRTLIQEIVDLYIDN